MSATSSERTVLVWQMPGGFAGEDLHRVGHRRLGPMLEARLGERAPRVVHDGGSLDDVLRRCAGDVGRPDALVLPTFREQLLVSLEAARALGERRPELPVLLSGWGCEPDYLDALGAGVGPRHPRLVYARGEPEAGLVDALCALFDGDAVRFDGAALGALGLALRDEAGGWATRGRFRPVEDLAALPSPLLSGALDPAETGGAALIEVARGCLFRCHFCLSCNFDPAGVRPFPTSRVVEELEWAKRRGATSVALLCSALNAHVEVIEAVAGALERLDPAGEMPVESTIHASLLDPRRLAATRRLRWRRMIVGLQSTNPAALAIMGRKVDPPAFAEAVERLATFHAPVVEIILGLPGDTPEGFRATLDFVLGLPAHVEIYHLRLDPGSFFMRDREALGLVADFRQQGKIVATPTFPAEALREAIDHVRGLGRGGWGHRARSLGFDFSTVWDGRTRRRGPSRPPRPRP